MSNAISDSTLAHFTTFGDLLKHLRRRAGLTQRELSIAVGYSTAQICRLEQNQRLPDLSTLTARFVPELGLATEPEAVSRLLDLAAVVRREDAPASGLPPFKGLLYFDEGDTELFFGREALTAQLAARITALLADPVGPRFLAVVGASGSGKSSVVRAGLIPALRWDAATAAWPVYSLTPTAHPLETLAASLLGEAMTPTTQAALVDSLAASPTGLQRTLEQQLQRANIGHALIVVDQFEELFTLCRGESERRAFVDNLMAAAAPAAGARQAMVVIALRADFYGHCAAFAQLRVALPQHQEYIGSMTAGELRRAIEEPARRGHWELEPGLVDELLRAVGADGARSPEPGALPLLSHALLETWQRRRGRALTLSGYAASGGVRGAIAETADAVFHDQLTPPQRATARHIFLRLTELGADETVPDTRRRVSLDELVAQPVDAPAVREVLTLLADARLITTDTETAEVAHEALIREWPTLRQWLGEDRASLQLHRQLTEAAQAWELTGRDEGLAFRGARLAQAVEWAAANPAAPNAFERAFLEASQALAERETGEREAQRQRELAAAKKLAEAETRRAADQGRAAQQLRRRAQYLAGALALAVAMTGAALFFGQQARQAASAAQANERLAFSRELAAAAVSGLDIDPERSLLLALEAVAVTYPAENSWTVEAEAALHRALEASRVMLTLRGHTQLVASVAFNADGTRLATASDDGTARVWDTTTGQTLLTVPTNAGYSHHGMAYSPDGTRLATASDNETARVWDAVTGEELLILHGHTDWVSGVAFSRDGTRLATTSEDRTSKIWDAATGELLQTLTGHIGAVWSIAFSPDGSHLLTGAQENTARVWDATTGATLLQLSGHTSEITGVAYNPDGTRLATASGDGTAKLWDAATGAELMTLRGHTGWVAQVSFSPDGTRVATTSFDGKTIVWDALTGQALLTLTGHTDVVLGVAFSPDGARLATTSADGTAKVWNVGLSRDLLSLQLPDLTAATLNPVCAGEPCGLRLAVGFADGSVSIWEVPSTVSSEVTLGAPRLTLSGHTAAIRALAFSADGARLATASDDQTATVWDAATGAAQLTLVGHTGVVWDIAFSADGAQIATSGNDYAFRIWDASTGEALYTLRSSPGANGLSFSLACPMAETCESRLATAHESGLARMWAAATGEEQLTLKGHAAAVGATAFSPDGTRVGTASYDGTARVWDTATGQALLTLSGQHGWVLGLAFSPDGTRLATSNQDGTAQIWDAAGGRALFTLYGHTAPVIDLAFSADGTRLLTTSADGTARFYLLGIEDLLALARARVTRDLTAAECQQYLHQPQCAESLEP